MFSDLVGSTALSARMDPEDLREIISAYQECVAQTVGRFGGFVAKYMGDGVLIYFGYPQAHEDDAERAVLAGLELVAAVTALMTHAALQISAQRRPRDRSRPVVDVCADNHFDDLSRPPKLCGSNRAN
jgi:class 3 adenylate cyclase